MFLCKCIHTLRPFPINMVFVRYLFISIALLFLCMLDTCCFPTYTLLKKYGNVMGGLLLRIQWRIPFAITYRNSLQKKHMTTPREHVLLNKKMCCWTKRWTKYTLQMSIRTSTFITCTAAREVHFASAIQKTYIIVHATFQFLIEWIGILTECIPRNDARM